MANPARRVSTTAKTSHLQVVPKPRNNRIHRRPKGWARDRKDKLSGSIDYANAASAHRRALQVSAQEVADKYAVSTAAVYHWESGLYMGWDADELEKYQAVCKSIAG